MTTIVVTFICDFTKNIPDVKNETPKETGMKEKGKKGKEKNKKGKKGKQDEIKEETKEKIKEEVKDEDLTVVVNVKKPTNYLHIEYNLLPGKVIYKIDVVFWGTIAKVYTKDGKSAMKSINKDGHYWIAFSIKHKVVLDENDLIKLKSHSASFSITTSKKKVGSSEAKKDGNKIFYFEEKAIESKHEFAEAFEKDPNVNKIAELEIDLKTQKINDIKYILNDLLDFPTKTEPLSAFHVIPDHLHQNKVLKVIDKISTYNKINCMNNLDEPLNVNELLAVKKIGKGKGEKKEKPKKDKKDKKQTKNDSSQILLSGELYFTHPSMTLLDLKLRNDDLSNSFVCIDIHHLMNADQKHELSPLIIGIHKIINIPRDILLQHGFSLIYASYNICNIDCKTGARPTSDIIHFKDHHVYFLENFFVGELAECIQNNLLIVQMHGIRLTPPEKQSEMFGQNRKDKYISKPLQNQHEVLQYTEGDKEINKKSVLLAVARIKLDELLKPFWQFIKHEQCVHPRFIRHLDENCDNFNKVTINAISVEPNNTFKQNPLTEAIILTSGLSIKVSVQLGNPIINILDEKIEEHTSLNRILLMIYQQSLAKKFMFNVYVHNAHWLHKKNIVPNVLKKSEDIPDEMHTRHAVTGFCIGCGDQSLMFLEGKMQWIYHFFWSVIRRENKQFVKVLFNSDYIYEKRLYTGLYVCGGVYFISLQYSLEYLLKCNKTYIKGHMPEPCRRALNKIDLIMKSNFMNDVRDTLLPTLKELISLNYEWGVGLHWQL